MVVSLQPERPSRVPEHPCGDTLPGTPMTFSALRLGAACGFLLTLTAPAGAQVIRLTRPDATLVEEFSSIRGVRELPDGRILVSDYTDQRVLLVDMDKGS